MTNKPSNAPKEMPREKSNYIATYNTKDGILIISFNGRVASTPLSLVPKNMKGTLLEEEKICNATDYLLNVLT